MLSSTRISALEMSRAIVSNPIWTKAANRWPSLAHSLRRRKNYESTTLRRWRVNLARLYARHLMIVAAASMAARQRTHLLQQQKIEKPSQWQNWERKDWADELLESLGSSKIGRVWSATRRLVNLGALVAPMAVLYPLGCLSNKIHQWSWDYALWGIEKAGPTYIKLFQWATTRQDLFSPEFCSHFGQLQDQASGHAWKHTEQLLEEELGDLKHYLELEKEPIGSGCIAQVYRGTLTKAADQYPEGTEIAVKVQHPGIWDKVCVDFYIMGKVANFLESLPYLNLSYLSLLDTVQQFRDIMLPQLDLLLESSHLKRFNRDFADDDQVWFPEPLDSLTATRVLTETFLHGKPIFEYKKASPEIRKELAYLGLSTTLRMIFLNDFLHGGE